MDRIPEATVISPRSYFWSCVTLSKDCPLFSTENPNLCYFGIVLASLYAALLLVILADLKFYWSVDHLQRQIDYYINLISKKVKHVHLDQRRLVSQQARTEKQLNRSKECTGVVTGIRGALSTDDQAQLTTLTSFFVETSPRSTWNVSQTISNFPLQ